MYQQYISFFTFYIAPVLLRNIFGNRQDSAHVKPYPAGAIRKIQRHHRLSGNGLFAIYYYQITIGRQPKRTFVDTNS